MTQKLILGAAVCAALAAFSPSVQAQRGQGFGPGRQSTRCCAPAFNPQSAATVRGEVVAIQRIPQANGAWNGIHMTLRTSGGTEVAHLGPDWYLSRLTLRLQPKDAVELTGFRTTVDGTQAFIAASVKKGSTLLILRDSTTGVPVWAGQGMGRGGGRGCGRGPGWGMPGGRWQ